MADVHSLLLAAAQQRGWRESSIRTYHGALKRIGIVDDSLSRDEIESRILALDNTNARRTAAIAVRAVLGITVRVPKGQPARYDLPSEDSLRLALMLSKHETRGLLMMYAGLRIGEACAVTSKQLDGDRLRVDRQVRELKAQPGYDRVVRLVPPKGGEGEVVLPGFLVPLVADLEGWQVPTPLRENLTRAGKKVGIHLTPHMLRHFYATESLRRGMAIATLSKQLRHSTVATTMNTYAQPRDQEVRDVWG